MIITDKFVFLFFPKTGSTFVRSVLHEIRRRTVTISNPNKLEFLLYRSHLRQEPYFEVHEAPNFRTSYRDGEKILGEHGNLRSIPDIHKNKVVISVVRNPFSRYVSSYEFRSWARNPLLDLNATKEQFPDFPEISFGDFLRYSNSCEVFSYLLPCVTLDADVGIQTILFIHFFFKDPLDVFRKLDEEYIRSEEYLHDIGEVTFLRTESLNRDLYDFLIKMGYNRERLRYILIEDRKNISTPQSKTWKEYFNQELMDYVRYKERFLFKLFPEYLTTIFE